LRRRARLFDAVYAGARVAAALRAFRRNRVPFGQQ
jgi:hypothetical protein